MDRQTDRQTVKPLSFLRPFLARWSPKGETFLLLLLLFSFLRFPTPIYLPFIQRHVPLFSQWTPFWILLSVPSCSLSSHLGLVSLALGRSASLQPLLYGLRYHLRTYSTGSIFSFPHLFLASLYFSQPFLKSLVFSAFSPYISYFYQLCPFVFSNAFSCLMKP